MTSSKNGNQILSGHLDGSIIGYNLESGTEFKVCTHHCPPSVLAWGPHILAAGND